MLGVLTSILFIAIIVTIFTALMNGSAFVIILSSIIAIVCAIFIVKIGNDLSGKN